MTRLSVDKFMTRRRRIRAVGRRSVAVLLLFLGAVPALAQTPTTVEVARVGVVTETPRGDSVVLGTVLPGTVLEVLSRQGAWHRVRSPERSTDWRSGWIHARYLTGSATPDSERESSEGEPLRFSVRGFGQVGGIRFTASDSFDAITGSEWGVMYGGGAQVGLSNGLFFQGSYERFEATGQRVFVFENEIFELGIDNTVTVTPIQFTVGYRQVADSKYVGYVGAGAGQVRLEERAAFSDPSEDVDETSVSYHVLGGVEYPLARWLWVGGEGQWSFVPDALGEDGVSQLFDETDLGGFTLRFKVSVGL